MRNRIINLGVVAEIAQALGDLNESVVFVGGAVISIYADDPAADEVRPTQDVDITLKLLDFSQRESLMPNWLSAGSIRIFKATQFAPINITILLWISWPQLIQCEDRRIAGIRLASTQFKKFKSREY